MGLSKSVSKAQCPKCGRTTIKFKYSVCTDRGYYIHCKHCFYAESKPNVKGVQNK